MKRLAAVILLGVATLIAQTNRGSISGTVVDQTGAIVPGASVTIVSEGTNQTRKITGAQNGTFLAADLEPVAYRVTVTAPGFAETVVEGVKVDTASTATVNVTLQTG